MGSSQSHTDVVNDGLIEGTISKLSRCASLRQMAIGFALTVWPAHESYLVAEGLQNKRLCTWSSIFPIKCAMKASGFVHAMA